jgi:hypothetical protein
MLRLSGIAGLVMIILMNMTLKPNYDKAVAVDACRFISTDYLNYLNKAIRWSGTITRIDEVWNGYRITITSDGCSITTNVRSRHDLNVSNKVSLRGIYNGYGISQARFH